MQSGAGSHLPGPSCIVQHLIRGECELAMAHGYSLSLASCSMLRAQLQFRSHSPASPHLCADGTGGVHPMMRNLTDAAPQEGEQAFRSGRAAAVDGAEDGVARAVAGRMMGDLATSGDAPFGGEVQVQADSRVRCCSEICPSLAS